MQFARLFQKIVLTHQIPRAIISVNELISAIRGDTMKISRQQLELYQAQAGMSASQLSEASGVSRQQISTIKGRGSCNPITAAKLAKGLGVPLETILEKEV